MNQRRKVRLRDISTKITKGTTPTTFGHPFTDSGINFIKAESVTREGLIDPSTFAFIDEKTHALLKRSQIEADDILLTIAGIYLGKVGIVRKEHVPANTNQAVAIVRIDKQQAQPEYVRYFLFERSTTEYLNILCPQSAQPNLNLTQLGGLRFMLPPLPTQRKIAAVLAAYDDLIEANRRRIALLERMAEEIYREWFVRLRFPGHATTKITKGLPAGWTLVRTQDAFSFTGGGTPSKEVSRYWQDGTINWFTPTDITAAEGMFLEESRDKCSDEGFAESSAKMFPAYSVMMTSRATIGSVGINLTPACTNQGFITCIPNERYPLPFLYHWIKLGKTHFEMLSVGATFAELTKGTFKKIPVLTPPQAVMDAFAETEAPLFKQIENLMRQNAHLTRTRDLLLPRLISGKLPVEAVPIAFPPSMADAR